MQEAQYVEITKYSDKFYYKDKEMTILHRLDGPAVEYGYGDKAWCINGEYISEDEFFKRTDWREDQHIVDLRFLNDTLAFDVDSASDLHKINALKLFRLLIEEMLEEAIKVKRANGFLG